jgi:hypothetical protein
MRGKNGSMKYVSALLLVISGGAFAATPQQDVCKKMGKSFISGRAESGTDYINIQTRTEYSEALDACLHIEIAVIGVHVTIRDLSRTLIRDGPVWYNFLMSCNVDGANSVRLDKLNTLKGILWNEHYSEYLDDGFGGPPATLETPPQPYTREDCQRLLDEWFSTAGIEAN